MPGLRFAFVLLATAAFAGCATRTARDSQTSVTAAVAQPMRDLTVIRDEIPPVLSQAVAAPYGPKEPPDCARLRADLAELDKALGPDVDAPGDQPAAVAGLAGDLVRGAVHLPFRGVVRKITGAERREAAYRHAVLAGMVRRGYVKGRLAAQACPPPAV